MMQESSAVGRSLQDASAKSATPPIAKERRASDDVALILAFFELLAAWEARAERAM